MWCADWDQDQALVPVTSTANSTGNIPKQSQQEYCAIVWLCYHFPLTGNIKNKMKLF